MASCISPLHSGVSFTKNVQFYNAEKPSVGTSINLSDFHVYRIFWRKDLLVWYIDDLEIHRINSPDGIPDIPMNFSVKTKLTGVPMWPDNQYDKSAKRWDLIPRAVNLEVDYVVIQQESEVNGSWSNDARLIAGTTTAASVVLLFIFGSAFWWKRRKHLQKTRPMRKKTENAENINASSLSALLNIPGTPGNGNNRRNLHLLQYVRLMEVHRETLEISESHCWLVNFWSRDLQL
jgi:hypothetical protein